MQTTNLKTFLGNLLKRMKSWFEENQRVGTILDLLINKDQDRF